MTAVIAGHVIAFGQRHAGANDLCLLTDAGMNGAGDLAIFDHLGRALIESSDPKHPALHFHHKIIA